MAIFTFLAFIFRNEFVIFLPLQYSITINKNKYLPSAVNTQERAAMEKLDLKKKLKTLYSPSAKEFEIIEVPPLTYLMVDGHGDPNNNHRFQDATQTLYSLSYSLKFHLKKTQGLDYTVMGLEGLWWMPDMREFSLERKADWDWTLMILQPDFVTPGLFAEARSIALGKGKAPLANETRFEQLNEGSSIQILYLGAYADEAPVIAQMHQYIREHRFTPRGKHHEIYLSDARKVAPEKNRTILRQPIARV
jgi:hypothetical protein